MGRTMYFLMEITVFLRYSLYVVYHRTARLHRDAMKPMNDGLVKIWFMPLRGTLSTTNLS